MSEKQMLVFDCETNGLLHDVSEIHCIAIYDNTKEETFVFNNQGSDWTNHGRFTLVIQLMLSLGTAYSV